MNQELTAVASASLFSRDLVNRLGLLVVVLVAGLVPHQLLAQVKTADVVGVITDKGGARVPGAMVTITNVATNVQLSVETDGDGNYLFTLLPPGRYRARAEKSGFKTATVADIALSVGDRLKLDVELDVGQVQETVQVTAETPALQSQTLRFEHSDWGKGGRRSSGQQSKLRYLGPACGRCHL